MAYIGNNPLSVAFLTDQFSGNGSTVAFTLSVAPANTASILVAVTGVVQDPSTYSVSGTTLTFSAAPPSGTGNISVRYLGIPASGVTTTAYRTVTDSTATAGQTTFTIPSYTVGYLNVYRNGVRLAAADFTATSGTTVVLGTAATAGDTITTESFYVSSVLNAIPATSGSVAASYLVTGSITPTYLAQPLTAGTAQASTSGTSIDFTGIPSWVKRITVIYYGVSTNGTSNGQIQIGSGSFTTSGYTSSAAFTGASTNMTTQTSGFLLWLSGGAGDFYRGNIVITNVSGNNWVCSNTLARADGYQMIGGGSVSLSGTLDRVRATTVSGTDTFDAGTINILYE